MTTIQITGLARRRFDAKPTHIAFSETVASTSRGSAVHVVPAGKPSRRQDFQADRPLAISERIRLEKRQGVISAHHDVPGRVGLSMIVVMPHPGCNRNQGTRRQHNACDPPRAL